MNFIYFLTTRFNYYGYFSIRFICFSCFEVSDTITVVSSVPDSTLQCPIQLNLCLIQNTLPDLAKYPIQLYSLRFICFQFVGIMCDAYESKVNKFDLSSPFLNNKITINIYKYYCMLTIYSTRNYRLV